MHGTSVRGGKGWGADTCISLVCFLIVNVRLLFHGLDQYSDVMLIIMYKCWLGREVWGGWGALLIIPLTIRRVRGTRCLLEPTTIWELARVAC